MPSIEESKRQVKASLSSEHDVNHDEILASLQDEIDNHNERTEEDETKRDDTESSSNRGDAKSMRFRFKHSTSESKKRKHRSRDDDGHLKHRESRRARRRDAAEEDVAHPFPREPTKPELPGSANSSAAFRESLFDALADDEGAAYWESVYSQPIHLYSRPTVQNARGELEEMNDDEYAAYVQTKMWEKKNPHIVLERERKEKQVRKDEEERTRQREEFVRKKQRAAWERAHNAGARRFAGVENDGDEDYEYVFDAENRTRGASTRTSEGATQLREYRQAWTRYLAAWDTLKHELLGTREAETTGEAKEPSKRIPWPVLPSKPVIKANIQDFIRNVPVDDEGPSKTQVLKSERVKWHPDKIQQRFRGQVDEGTMKIVTGVFQVVDALLEEDRKGGH